MHPATIRRGYGSSVLNSENGPVTRPTRGVRAPLAVAAAADVLCVVVFAAGGRSSHDEQGGLGGLLTTAWPFLAGAALGWALVALVPALAGRGTARGSASARLAGVSDLAPAGLVVAGAAWAGGMLLRLATGQGVSGAFPLVALGFLAVTLLGWRGVVALVSRAARRRSSAPRP